MKRMCKAAMLSFLAGLISQALALPSPPRLLEPKKAAENVALNIISLPDGSFAFIDANNLNGNPVVVEDENGDQVALLPAFRVDAANQKISLGKMSILSKNGELYSIDLRRRYIEEGRRIGVNSFLDIWFSHTTGQRTEWTEPVMIWEGYTGAVMEYQQLSNGRILIPFGAWIPNCPCAEPIGCNETTVIYSDDHGQRWRQIKQPIQAPAYKGYNGNNYGACEPVIEPLKDGSIWMLMRSQTGFLYESMSYDNGENWLEGRASRFNSSHGPPALFRHENGWLIVVWNNFELPSRIDGRGVYGGRDALHIAVSADDGKTWRGFREIYRDAYRNDSPPRKGDRGTAYPLGSYTKDGKIAVLSGQGEGRRKVSLIEPKWVIADKASTDFSNGLEEWHVYKPFGPIENWWRDRMMGCRLVQNPVDPTLRSLQIGKPDDNDADGAVWNFPNGWKGSVRVQLMLRKGFQGGVICLNDRMFDPTDDNGQRFAIFAVDFTDAYKLSDIALKPDQWYDLTLKWDLSEKTCRASIDGKTVPLAMKNKTLNGISYIRFRSLAKAIDNAGFLIGRVETVIDDPAAPPCDETDKKQAAETYRDEFMPFWNKQTGTRKNPVEKKPDGSPVEVEGQVLG